MKRMKNIRLGTLVACMCVLWGCEKPNVNIVMPQEASNRVLFAGEHLKKALEDEIGRASCRERVSSPV